jgi:hypothetical protein
MRHKIKMLEIVFDSVAAGLGDKKTQRKLKKGKKKKLTNEQKEQLLLSQLNKAGFQI